MDQIIKEDKIIGNSLNAIKVDAFENRYPFMVELVWKKPWLFCG
ncbi:MAG TPA: hypothetical protein VD908_04755 [Cytophagales bacterium]|nr:hypothetical protein [Cytophagales bacterium]